MHRADRTPRRHVAAPQGSRGIWAVSVIGIAVFAVVVSYYPLTADEPRPMPRLASKGARSATTAVRRAARPVVAAEARAEAVPTPPPAPAAPEITEALDTVDASTPQLASNAGDEPRPSGSRRASRHMLRFELPSAPPELEPEPAEPEPPPQPAAQQRQVDLTVLRRWQQPGLCAVADEASAAHQGLIARFRAIDWGGARLFLDPRLPIGSEAALLAQLERAERETAARLTLRAPRPDVFAYADPQLLLAAACTNAEVVAYYDGALHVVPSDADVEQSVLHEYTHHVLMSAGMIGPAWAQEGIAMHVARETWWRDARWLTRLSDEHFALEDMESVVPYTLTADQAVLFYAQSAVMVACASEDEANGLAGLVSALATGSNGRELSYDLPGAADPSLWRTCVGGLTP